MGRGRKPGFKMTDEHRGKIQQSSILNALIEHVEGKRDMSATQVTAGLGLLRKTLPDLSQAEVTTEHVHRYVARVPEKVKDVAEWERKHEPQIPTLQ